MISRRYGRTSTRRGRCKKRKAVPGLRCLGPAPALLAPDLRAMRRVLANRAYDADYMWAQLAQVGAKAVIPSKKNRKQFIAHDRESYKHRNQFERCINRFKAYRGLATRFGKTASACLAIITLTAISMWH